MSALELSTETGIPDTVVGVGFPNNIIYIGQQDHQKYEPADTKVLLSHLVKQSPDQGARQVRH
jgi:hypothetical protein